MYEVSVSLLTTSSWSVGLLPLNQPDSQAFLIVLDEPYKVSMIHAELGSSYKPVTVCLSVSGCSRCS